MVGRRCFEEQTVSDHDVTRRTPLADTRALVAVDLLLNAVS